MNIGYEEDELRPHIEPARDYNDPIRIGNDCNACVVDIVARSVWCFFSPPFYLFTSQQ